MKFIKRKSQRDEFPQYVEPQRSMTAEAAPPVAKDLPPPPLYARYAKMASSSSFESLNAGLESPSASRFSGYNGSTPSLASHNGEGSFNMGSQGRAAGAALLTPTHSASNVTSTTALKPEPIKLKPRRVRTTNDDTPKVLPTPVEQEKTHKMSTTPREATSASVDRSVSNPDVPSAPTKKSLENSISPSTSNATAASNLAANPYPSHNRMSAPPLPVGQDGPSIRATSSLHTMNGASTPIPQRHSITPVPTATRSTTLDADPPRPVPPKEDDIANTGVFNNTQARGLSTTVHRSPFTAPPRPKAAPPIALLNRIAREQQQQQQSSENDSSKSSSTAIPTSTATTNTATTTFSFPSTNDNGDLLVKPPSRRESLQHAAKIANDASIPPVSPISLGRRSPSPVKARATEAIKTSENLTGVQRQPAYPEAAPPNSASGMAGVNAAGRSITSPSLPAPSGTPNTVLMPTANGKLTASPQVLPVDHKYTNMIPEKTPLVRRTPSFTKENASAASTPSSESAPKPTPTTTLPTVPPTPSSAASSAATVRQSRIIPKAPDTNGTSLSEPKSEAYLAQEQLASMPSTKDRILALESKVGGSLRAPSTTAAASAATTPSRQSSVASAASSSIPSVSNPRYTATQASIPDTTTAPEAASPSRVRSPESVDVSKITLTKGGTKINGVTYRRGRDTSPTDHRRSHQPNGTSTATNTTTATSASEAHEEREVRDGQEAPEEPRKSRSRHGHSSKTSRSSHEQPQQQQQQQQENVIHQERHASPPPRPAAVQATNHIDVQTTNHTNVQTTNHTNAHAPNHTNVHPTSHTSAQTVNHTNGRSSMERKEHRRSARPRSPPSSPPAHQPGFSHVPREANHQSQTEPEAEAGEEEERFYPIEFHLGNPDLLKILLLFMEFSDILSITSVSKVIRNMVEDRRELREEILERFLNTVGYTRWDFGKKREPLALTLRDLNSYLRGVSIPIHRYAEIAEGQKFSAKDGKSRIVRLLASSTRAYSKVVLRLRAQAEMEQSMASPNLQAVSDPSRPSSPLVRAQSPPVGGGMWRRTFHSPLYRIGHAPLLRVFVPSPEGPWLSDASVLACEKELKRAGVVQLLKVGDVIWDSAVSDEAGFGNAGKLVWDGNYLIDLDYTFSTTGDIPPYLHSLCFPPAYFHRVLRSTGNPIMQLDLRPWGREIASNLQLIQDRGSAETPQGGRHAVMRWVHRSSFLVSKGVPIPDTNLCVDAGWEGRIVIEVEGTNEGLADLQLRCGMEYFKPQPGVQPKQGDGGRAFRLIRERSRPGEIWLRAVRMKERIT